MAEAVCSLCGDEITRATFLPPFLPSFLPFFLPSFLFAFRFSHFTNNSGYDLPRMVTRFFYTEPNRLAAPDTSPQDWCTNFSLFIAPSLFVLHVQNSLGLYHPLTHFSFSYIFFFFFFLSNFSFYLSTTLHHSLTYFDYSRTIARYFHSLIP